VDASEVDDMVAGQGFCRDSRVARAALMLAAAIAFAEACGGSIQSNSVLDGGSPDSAPVVVVGDSGAADVVAADALGADANPGVTDASDDDGCNSWLVQELAVPVFDPPPGDVVEVGQRWSITCPDAPPGTTIYYTTDGTIPLRQGSVFAGPSLPFTSIGRVTINAICSPPPGVCLWDSPLSAATYTVVSPDACGCPMPTVTFSPSPADMIDDFTCAMVSDTPGATLCYTTDGTTPTCDAASSMCTGVSKAYDPTTGLVINGALTDGTGAVNVQAIACGAGMLPSAVSATTYTLVVDDPTMVPGSGTYSLPGDGGGLTPSILTITHDSPGSPVWITLATDGGTPSCGDFPRITNNNIFGRPGAPPALRSTTAISAVACKQGYKPSNVVSFTYTIR
jgi:hypothetical protein